MSLSRSKEVEVVLVGGPFNGASLKIKKYTPVLALIRSPLVVDVTGFMEAPKGFEGPKEMYFPATLAGENTEFTFFHHSGLSIDQAIACLIVAYKKKTV